MAAMAVKGPSESRPEVGDILLVIHDFQARSSDELSLAKGDRVELIERDDEFGDGWFLGRHLVNKNTGLFPEVYTRTAPKNVPTLATNKPLPPLQDTPPRIEEPASASSSTNDTGVADEPASKPSTPPASEPVTLPLNSKKTDSVVAPKTAEAPTLPTLAISSSPNQDNPVLHETLNVINEHITDLRSTPSNGGLRAHANDSDSEYSSTPLDHRTSYIAGEETDEEEDDMHSREEVEGWSPDAVAEYLFTNGVEKHHCEVFRDQEISGEVLLTMDQSSLFIKAFDLGSVGRRLKTWHKIKALQDEVNGIATRRATQTYGSDAGDDARRSRSRTNTLTSRPASIQTKRMSLSQTPKPSPTYNASNVQGSPVRPNHVKRPSAASVREMQQSRRYSSTDYQLAPGSSKGASNGVHKKQPSFDRNWTLGSALTTPNGSRPLSSTGLQDLLSPSGGDMQDSAVELDRGYFSGTEADGRKRNLLRKRDSVADSRKSTYTDEQRVRSATVARTSRFGSVGSLGDGGISAAAHKYYGVQSDAHRRTASSATNESIRGMPQAGDKASPTVTKLDTARTSSRSTASPSQSKHPGFNSDWLVGLVSKPMSLAGGKTMRAISDNLGSKNSTPLESPSKDFIVESPARTGSTTPSGGPSLDLEPADAAQSPSTTTQTSKNSRKKGKKETSAYTQGLLKISPREAMKDADYSGWMRKKSSKVMTTWKPRLFVLKGRRLAYYYSEDDEQEKGLIDISFHRVLPADNEKLTGLHATLTSVVGGAGQGMPASHSPTNGEEKDAAMFIFKLVPPRAGLSRAVNFTKPTVHYFAVPNLQAGRLWMAALMKATIDRDDTKPITTTYQAKTISLAKAKQMRHRPPALMNLEEGADETPSHPAKQDSSGLGISFDEADSGVSGVERKHESVKNIVDSADKESTLTGQSA